MSYSIKDRFAIVTGGGSGIGHALVRLLLNAGCSVAIADLKLRPEAEATVRQFSNPSENKGAVFFCQTDVSDWAQISSLWKTTLERFDRIDILVNCAGVYEAPGISFWNPPGISPLAEDPEDAKVGQYKIFSVNTIAPIRLAQIAIDYWQQHSEIEGNLLFVASMGGYVHSMQTPLYFASKAALVSMVKSLSGLKMALGIRNAAICPGAVFTPIFEPEYCRDRLQGDDVALEAEHVAELSMKVLQDAEYGNGNIMEIMMVGTKEEPEVHVAEVDLMALYPKVNPIGARAIAEEMKFYGKIEDAMIEDDYIRTDFSYNSKKIRDSVLIGPEI
ncbi:nad-dependent 15-hydroxyprostaglandin dehydrogenase [Fusarium heterosporum]|uniref:Nad-dependent 15-hydroxyprostaglandin dehydrogenase n=1 Tax=Fusarium heterosporum TaxID=42747 RepID=A0A8H5T8I3_FUSHE|nr:nad-dependent 15-hydroxyprostaglandin dehydrogenase [Fusarium heterosporum]